MADDRSIMRYLITGVNGFSGRHLAARLLREPCAVVLGTGRRGESSVLPQNYRPCDLTCAESVAALVAWADADVVFHLAGLNGMDAPSDLERVNLASYIHLSDSLRRSNRKTRLVTIGSAAEFGNVAASDLPATERTACRPQSAYGRSKHEITRRALSELRSSSLEVIVARPFNLVGAGLDRRLALGSFAAQVISCERGLQQTIECGQLSCRRDYLDIGDAVDAYLALATRGEPGQLYHVCSGRDYEMSDLLKRLMVIACADARIISETGPRATGPQSMFGDHRKLSQQTGWRPMIPIDTSLQQLLAYEAETDRGNVVCTSRATRSSAV